MRKRLGFRIEPILIGLVVLTSSCSEGITSSDVVTTTFGGTLAAGGFTAHSVAVSKDGTIGVTLTSLSPQNTITVGIGIGQVQSDGTCGLLTSTGTAKVGTELSVVAASGTYCAALYDIGNVSASVSYVLTVTVTPH